MPRPLPYLRFRTDSELLAGRAAIDVCLARLKADRRDLLADAARAEGQPKAGLFIRHRRAQAALLTCDIRSLAALRGQVSRVLRDRGSDEAYRATAAYRTAVACSRARFAAALARAH